ncbi:MAG: NAD(P)/FAD-dependent oxidoreductase [Aulosira sp. DedQUE10]|nr:NAD(P)/FAD-dependent oxidoreductase [Aulosira sp. DedQUE10]
MQTSDWQINNSGQQRRAVIVGAGPAGTLMALYLAQMHWQVSVYERRDSYEQWVSNGGGVNQSGRSYNIVLTERALFAFKQAGVDLPPEQSVLLQGNVRHINKGIQFHRQLGQSISINRNVLAMHLTQEGNKRFPDKIAYKFGYTLSRVLFDQKIAFFDSDSGSVEQPFDLLVGADGVFSSVRAAMIEHFDGISCQQHKDDMMLKVCLIEKATELPNAQSNWDKCFHTWPSYQPVSILASPNPDGSLTGIFIMPPEGEMSFEKLKNEEDVQALFKNKFPDIFGDRPLPESWAKSLLEQKASYGGITTICSALDGGDCAVLIGDSGHSVWASLGQGCNVALESCRVLAETLATHNGNLSQALPAYTSDRKLDVDAIARMSEQGFGGNKRVGNAMFFAKLIVLSLLNKVLPNLVNKPAIVQIARADVRYSESPENYSDFTCRIIQIFTSIKLRSITSSFDSISSKP